MPNSTSGAFAYLPNRTPVEIPPSVCGHVINNSSTTERVFVKSAVTQPNAELLAQFTLHLEWTVLTTTCVSERMSPHIHVLRMRRVSLNPDSLSFISCAKKQKFVGGYCFSSHTSNSAKVEH